MKFQGVGGIYKALHALGPAERVLGDGSFALRCDFRAGLPEPMSGGVVRLENLRDA